LPGFGQLADKIRAQQFGRPALPKAASPGVIEGWCGMLKIDLPVRLLEIN
jgi:hypothetical protein